MAREIDAITFLQGHSITAFVQKHIPTEMYFKELGGKYKSDHFSDKRGGGGECLPNFSWLKRGRKLKTLAYPRIESLL